MTGSPPRVAVCTALTANFAPWGRVLADSLRARHPSWPLFALVAERAEAVWHDEAFTTVGIESMAVPGLRRQAFLHSPHELTVLGKPLILRHALRQGFDAVLFIDSDILITGDLSPLAAATAAHAVTLTPHLLTPLRGPTRAARELTMIRSGTFNGGLVGVGRHPDALPFLDWWQARLLTHNWMEPWAGLHHDQRWLDLVPSFFEQVAIVRDPGCNVAYWNLPERTVRRQDDALLVDGGPCRFIHFSGFDPLNPDRLSRHAPEVTPADLGDPGVVADYAARLRAAGIEHARQIPYSFATFDDGVPIPDLARTILRQLSTAGERFENPFATSGPNSYRDWLLAPDPTPGPGAGLPPLWRHVHSGRADLQQAFPDPGGGDRDRFTDWVQHFGVHEHRIDARLR
jgi:hypothetical protein